MDRRTFLKTAASAGASLSAGALATPAISQRAAARALRLVPHADVANFDPIWTTAYIARNAGLLVWDTLYGVDNRLAPQRQMVEAETVSPDGLVWTFRLRPSLKFHDGEPVLAKDAVASINRWAARDAMGQMIKAIENELVATDDRTFRWSLKKPYPKMLLALGKIGTPCCFVMPARVAATDPFKQITEYVGSGPMRFVKDEWAPGARAVFEKFADYVPREEPPSWLSGRQAHRLEPDRMGDHADQATASAALQNGEVDWLEVPLPDIIPTLKEPHHRVDVADPLGSIGTLFFNHLYPPFNDVRARRAVLMALAQEDYMRAYVGDDDEDVEAAARLLHARRAALHRGRRRHPQRPARHRGREAPRRRSGYAGEPVTMAAQDNAGHKAWGDVTADLLQSSASRSTTPPSTGAPWWRAGRRSRRPARAAGRFSTPTSTASTASIPTSRVIRANGEKAFFGWPNIPQVEAEVAAWYEAEDARGGKGRRPPAQQSGDGARDLRPARRLPPAAGLAHERHRRDQGAAAVLLEGEQDRVRRRRDAAAIADIHIGCLGR